MRRTLGTDACFVNRRRWRGAWVAALLAGCHGAIEPGAGSTGSSPAGEWGQNPGREPTGSPAGRPPGSAQRPSDGRNPAVPADAACEGVAAGPARLRRLQPDEYANTARALLEAPDLAPHLEPQAGEIITALEVEALNRAANELSAEGAHERYAPCKLDGSAAAACARGFIDAFGKAAFRRPLETDERDWLVATYEQLLAADVQPAFTFREAIAGVAEVILQAPQHVYVHELGVPDPALPPGMRALSGHERASRLSYLLTSSMPDAELTRAADSGELDTADGVRAQAERMLEAPAARAMVRDFASRWLRLNDTPQHPALEKLAKDAAKFPLDSPELRRAMRTESEALYERAFFDPDGSFAALLTAPRAYVDGPLAALYGVEDGPRGAGEFAWVDLPSAQRAGIFTRAAFLTAFASADYQSPVLRGVHVVRHVLCQPLPDPPADVDNTPPVPSDADVPRSVRELFEAKTSNGSCQSCHKMVNPVGFTLESYDALGRWQTTESGTLDGRPFTVPVDTAAELAAGDLTGPVSGAVELSQRLAQSDVAHDCMVQTWFERALSRAPGDREACALRAIMDEFRATSDLRALVLNLASSDSALFIEEEVP